MFSLEDLKNVKFKKIGFGGYNPDDVNEFVNDVIFFCENLISKNFRSSEKIKKLQATIDKFYEEENAIRKALVGAQKIADSSVMEAEKKAEKILCAAKEKAKQLSDNFLNDYNKNQEELKFFKTELRNFKKKILEVCDKHIEIIDKISDKKSIKFAYNSNCSQNYLPQNQNIKFIPKNKISITEEKVDILDVFSDEPFKDKHKNLEFGENFVLEAEKNEQTGVYSGLFKKIHFVLG